MLDYDSDLEHVQLLFRSRACSTIYDYDEAIVFKVDQKIFYTINGFRELSSRIKNICKQ